MFYAPCVRVVAARIEWEPRGRGKTELAQYGLEFKECVVARLLQPESSPIEEVSNKIEVSVATLERGVSRPRILRAAASLYSRGAAGSGDRHRRAGHGGARRMVPRARRVRDRAGRLEAPRDMPNPESNNSYVYNKFTGDQ
jgi:predicted DNA-binding protein (UPF0251 family)